MTAQMATKLTLRTFKHQKRKVTIDYDQSKTDVTCEFETIPMDVSPNALIDHFDTKMAAILNKLAPEEIKTRTLGPRSYLRFNDKISDQRRPKRKYERAWQKSNDPKDRELY